MSSQLEAYDFNGTGSLYSTIPSVPFGSNFTIETMIKNSNATQKNFASIVMRGNAATANGLFIYGNKLSYRSGESGGQGFALEDFNTTNYPIGEWVHIALVVENGKSFKLYRNFDIVASGTLPYNSTSTATPLSQGDWSPNYNSYFIGSLGLTRIWSRGLTIDELKGNYRKYIDSDDSLFYRLSPDMSLYSIVGTVLRDNTIATMNNRIVLENENNYYSLDDKTLIHLPDASNKSIILLGIKVRKLSN